MSKAKRVLSGTYPRVWAPDHQLANGDGYVLEHRMVAYDAGMEIRAGDHVHHINGDKHDNRPENLQVVTAGDHMRIHHPDGSKVLNQHGSWVVGERFRSESPSDARARRRSMMESGFRDFSHGLSGYTNWSCRCDECRSEYRRYRRRKRSASPSVDK